MRLSPDTSPELAEYKRGKQFKVSDKQFEELIKKRPNEFDKYGKT